MPAGKICCTGGCGKPAVPNGSRCVKCTGEREAARGTRQQRGYDARHDQDRVRLLALWAAAQRRGQTWYCPRCRRELIPGQLVDADHFGEALLDNPNARADALSHRRCNRGARPATPGP